MKISKKQINKIVKATDTNVANDFACGINYTTGFLFYQVWAQNFSCSVFHLFAPTKFLIKGGVK